MLDFVALDHYYHNLFPGETYALLTKQHRLMRAMTTFPVCGEFQCGVWEGMQYNLGLIEPRHFEFMSLAALAHGIKGMNYYMLVARDNWYFTPISERGEKRTKLAEKVRRITSLFRDIEVPNLEYQASLGLLWYRPHHDAFLLEGQRQQFDFMDYRTMENLHVEGYPSILG